MLLERRASGVGYLALTTDLLQTARRRATHAGLWEAADLQWWWRKDQHRDIRAATFWLDGRQPLATRLFAVTWLLTSAAVQPCPYRARAWWGDELIAETNDSVRVDEPDQPPLLFFPSVDVRFDLLPEGEDLLLSVPGPEGMAAFDHDRVRVELVDQAEGDAPRDVTIKRFPTWGDASDLVELLDLALDSDAAYVSGARGWYRRTVLEGSQMLGQSIVAAGRHAAGRRVVSAHMVFMRAADAGEPLRFELEELSAGRMFTTLLVHVMQRGERVASGTFLLDITAPDVIRHAEPPPPAAGPYESEPVDMFVTGRDLRIVDNTYTNSSDAPVGPPVLEAWVRFRRVPPDPSIHAGLLAQFTGHLSIAAALRPHAGIGQKQAHRTLSTAPNAIGISFHAQVRADQWMRYRHLSTFAGDGMTHSECRVYDEHGALLASFTVDAMVRAFAAGTVGDERTSL